MRKYLGLTALLLLGTGLSRADTKIRPTNLNTDPGLTWRLGGVIVGPHGAMSVDSGQTPGSVTSVNAVSGIPGLSLAGGPITGAGTFTLGLTDAAALRAAMGLAIGTDIPSKTGTGASGTWPISITGSATSATGPAYSVARHGNVFQEGGWDINGLGWTSNTGIMAPSFVGALTGNADTASGLISDDGTPFTYDTDSGAWATGGDIAATHFRGNGSTLTSLSAAALTGTAAVNTTGYSAGIYDPATSSAVSWDASTSRFLSTAPISAPSFVGSGASLTALNGSNVTTGTVAPARLGTGTPSTSTYLRGDGAWTAPPYLTSSSSLDATKLTGTASVNTTGTAAGLSTTLAVGSGGTGATSASAARTALGLAIGTDVLAPSGSGTGLSGVALLGSANTFTGDQSVTGKVTATGTLRGNATTGTGGSSAVAGLASGAGNGIYGSSVAGTAIFGTSSTGGSVSIGVYGEATGDGNGGNFRQNGTALASLGRPAFRVDRLATLATNTNVTGDLLYANDAATVSGTGLRLNNLLRLQKDGADKFLVDLNGQVGIGGVTPTYALHVAPSSGDTAGQTAFFKGSADTGLVIKAGSAQAAKPWQYQSSGGTPLTYITTGGDVVITDATKGTIRRSPSGHYWRTTVGDTGTLTTTDLGTTAP
jgi:hypothetical protein